MLQSIFSYIYDFYAIKYLRMSVFEERKEKYDCLPQFLSALAVSLCASVVGGWMSFTSVAIPKMMNNTDQTNLTALQEYQDPITIDLHEGILEGGGDFTLHILPARFLDCQLVLYREHHWLPGWRLRQHEAGGETDPPPLSPGVRPHLGHGRPRPPALDHLRFSSYGRHHLRTLPGKRESLQR